MGSETAYPRGRLGRFLLRLLDEGKIEGLEWIDRNKKLFKIPWMDKRNPVWSSSENTVLKEWEKLNKRYQEGDPEDWAKWKQTFRGALTHSPDISSVREMFDLKNKSMPFVVYQFLDKVHLGNSDAVIGDEAKMSLSMNGYSPQMHVLPENNIPKVVMDELNTSAFSNPEREILTDCDTPKKVYGGMQELENNMVVDHQMAGDAFDDISIDPNSQFKLDSDEFSKYFSPNYPSDEMMSLPSLNTPKCSLESKKAFVKFQTYYFNNHVLEGFIYDKVVNLFFGTKLDENFLSLFTPEIFGSQELEQVDLPDVKTCSSIKKEKNVKLIEQVTEILENMKRGLLLYRKDDKLFAFRSCTTCVSACNDKGECIRIDRKSKTPCQLFDMDIFRSQLASHKADPQNYPRPSAKVILVFGQKCNLQSIISRELLMHIEVTYTEAEELLQKELPNGHSVLLSELDSFDEHIQRLINSLSLNGQQTY